MKRTNEGRDEEPAGEWDERYDPSRRDSEGRGREGME